MNILAANKSTLITRATIFFDYTHCSANQSNTHCGSMYFVPYTGKEMYHMIPEKNVRYSRWMFKYLPGLGMFSSSQLWPVLALLRRCHFQQQHDVLRRAATQAASSGRRQTDRSIPWLGWDGSNELHSGLEGAAYRPVFAGLLACLLSHNCWEPLCSVPTRSSICRSIARAGTTFRVVLFDYGRVYGDEFNMCEIDLSEAKGKAFAYVGNAPDARRR